MKIKEQEESKIFLTKHPLKWIQKWQKEKDVIIITPLTKIKELFNLKNQNVLKKILFNFSNDILEKGINVNNLNAINDQISNILNLDIFNINIDVDKIIKTFFEINEEIIIDSQIINNYLKLLNKYTHHQIQVIIHDFDVQLEDLSMITSHKLITETKGFINWTNLEQLVILDKQEIFEVIDRDKFKSWLEMQVKSVLTIKDIQNYFEGSIHFNSFLIQKAIDIL